MTGEADFKPVTHKFVNDDRLTYELVVINEYGESESLDATDNHPFMVEGYGWVETIGLQTGMIIESYDGRRLIVVSLVALARSPITYMFFNVFI